MREDAVFEGLGVGNVYPSTEVIYANKKVPFEGAPHNSYVLLFSEQGLICFIFMTILFLIFFVNGYKKNKELMVFMLFVMMTVIFSETATTTNSEYVYLLSILMLMINSDHKYLALPVQNFKKIKLSQSVVLYILAKIPQKSSSFGHKYGKIWHKFLQSLSNRRILS